jgi:hypothetical protein
VTARLPCPPAPEPLEAYAACFDALFASLAQRKGFRAYLAGLLAPTDRNNTLTCLAGAEPMIGAQHRQVQALQWSLSESRWDHQHSNARRLELLLTDPATAPHATGVRGIDDSADRKDGHATAPGDRQGLGRYGKTDNCVVTVTTVGADAQLYYPLHACPYTPAPHFPRARTMRPLLPNRSSLPIWSAERFRSRRLSPRWSPRAPPGTPRSSASSCAAPGWRTGWPSTPTRAPGRGRPTRIPPWMPPAPWPGRTRIIRATTPR